MLPHVVVRLLLASAWEIAEKTAVSHELVEVVTDTITLLHATGEHIVALIASHHIFALWAARHQRGKHEK